MGKLITAIVAALTGNTAVAVASWVATRALLIIALYVVLPFILYHVQSLILGEVVSFIVDRLNNITPVPFEQLEVAGVLGWMAIKLRLATCLNLLLTAMQVRFAISLYSRQIS